MRSNCKLGRKFVLKHNGSCHLKVGQGLLQERAAFVIQIETDKKNCDNYCKYVRRITKRLYAKYPAITEVLPLPPPIIVLPVFASTSPLLEFFSL